MRFEWFEVQGYKNIRTPLRMDQLGGFNVLHGDNNVGKSNLMESIGLLFVLLHALREDARGGPSLSESFKRQAPPTPTPPGGAPTSTVRSESWLTDRAFPPDEIFNLKAPEPITLRAKLRLDTRDREPSDPAWLVEPIEIGVRLERREDELGIQLDRLVRADGTDLLTTTGSEASAAVVLALSRLGPRPRGKVVEPRFAMIRADRTMVADSVLSVQAPAPLSTREPLPSDLGLTLHRAEDAMGVQRQRFDLLLGALDRFSDLLGDGEWRTRYDPDAERAELLFDGSDGRVPLRLMGSGIQQIAVLVARLVMTGADIVAIEEPELNLRWKAQHRLRDALREIMSGEGGLSQLFVTSHSAAFEFEPMFYAISRSADGPHLERRPAADAPRLLNPEVERPPEGASAPLSYVTTEGLLRVPDEVRAALGLSQGGGVTFVEEKDHKHFRMLSDEQFLDLIEPGQRPK
jgi:hypothetical protein